MSRASLPRRNCVWPILFTVLGWMTVPAVASAQEPLDSNFMIVIGRDEHARACLRQVAAGDYADPTLAECTRALTSSQVPPLGRQQVRISRGVLYLNRDRPAEALADFDEVLRNNPRNAEAHANRGSALMALNRHGEAVAEFTQAVGLGVQAPHMSYYNRGAAREALRDWRGAMEDYATALEIEPDWGPANAEMARFARMRREELRELLAEREAP